MSGVNKWRYEQTMNKLNSLNKLRSKASVSESADNEMQIHFCKTCLVMHLFQGTVMSH